jgi:hypothetical protein
MYSPLLSDIKYRIIILPVPLYSCETWTLILREEHTVMVSENGLHLGEKKL